MKNVVELENVLEYLYVKCRYANKEEKVIYSEIIESIASLTSLGDSKSKTMSMHM